MLKIRLARTGRRNQPSFRIVVQEDSQKPTGRMLEILGTINPRLKTRTVNKERAAFWLGRGAQPSETVHNFFVDQGLIKGDKYKIGRAKKKAADHPAAEVAPALGSK